MKKMTKLITTMVAMFLVAGFMLIGIFAATEASSTISASVSWTSTPGITFTLDAQVVNNPAQNGIGTSSTPARIPTQSVTNQTSNEQAGNILVNNLNCDFYDSTPNDGVNNPSPIKFTYTIVNTGSTSFKVRLSKYPQQAEESGETSATHKPKVVYGGTNAGVTLTSTDFTNIISPSSGVTVAGGQTLIFTVTLSMATASTAITDADLSIVNFDAGVGFSMTM